MTKTKWEGSEKILREFQAVGRALLQCDIEDSHSGNISTLCRNAAGEEQIAITSTGSQKGALERDNICYLSPTSIDTGYYKASSETDIHARILAIDGVNASVHAHTKNLTVVTMDDADKPNEPPPFVPIDPLGRTYLEGRMPVDWVAVPSGSPEMAQKIPDRLADHPATILQGHGTFAKGRTVKEALFLICVAENAGTIVRTAEKIGIDTDALRKRIAADPGACFPFRPSPYTVEGDDRCDFPEEDEIVREFHKAGHRIFESRLSPFHTGSLSVRGVDAMLYAPKASMPHDLAGPLLKVSLDAKDSDTPEQRIHKAIYSASNFQTIAHCYVPEAEALSHFVQPGGTAPDDRIVAIDAEGSFLYLVVPILPPDFEIERMVHLLHDYKVVIVRGGGVWGVGAQSLSEVLHHPSSVREICLYRIGAYERGLDVRKMESPKARNW